MALPNISAHKNENYVIVYLPSSCFNVFLYKCNCSSQHKAIKIIKYLKNQFWGTID